MGEIDVRLAREGLGIPGNVARPYIYEGGDIGRGLAGLGNGVRHLGRDLDRLNARLEADRAATAGNDMAVWEKYRRGGGDYEGPDGVLLGYEGALNKKNNAAIGERERYAEDFRKRQKEIAEFRGLDGRALEQFNLRCAELLANGESTVGRYELGQYDAVNAAATKQTVQAQYESGISQVVDGMIAADGEYLSKMSALNELPTPEKTETSETGEARTVEDRSYHDGASARVLQDRKQWIAGVIEQGIAENERGIDAFVVREAGNGVDAAVIRQGEKNLRKAYGVGLVEDFIKRERFDLAVEVLDGHAERLTIDPTAQQELRRKIESRQSEAVARQERIEAKALKEAEDSFDLKWISDVSTGNDLLHDAEMYKSDIDADPVLSRHPKKQAEMKTKVDKHFKMIADDAQAARDQNGHFINGKWYDAKYFATKPDARIEDYLVNVLAYEEDPGVYFGVIQAARSLGLLTDGQFGAAERMYKVKADKEFSKELTKVFGNPEIAALMKLSPEKLAEKAGTPYNLAIASLKDQADGNTIGGWYSSSREIEGAKLEDLLEVIELARNAVLQGKDTALVMENVQSYLYSKGSLEGVRAIFSERGTVGRLPNETQDVETAVRSVILGGKRRLDEVRGDDLSQLGKISLPKKKGGGVL